MNQILQKRGVSYAFVVAALIGGLGVASPALAGPQKVTYKGAAVTTAVPGKAFKMNFQVKNTSEDTYSGIKVIFHFPGDFTISAVGPGDSVIDGNEVYWTNVPLNPGKSFYPSFTLATDSGMAIGSKQNIWIEVTGLDGMPSTSQNFSITAVKKVAVATLSSAQVSDLFKGVYGRVPTASELKYWLGRRSNKPGSVALQGAMAFHKAQNIAH